MTKKKHFKEGTIKKGNDGRMYISEANKNGVLRWHRYTIHVKNRKLYKRVADEVKNRGFFVADIIDNCGVPYKVRIESAEGKFMVLKDVNYDKDYPDNLKQKFKPLISAQKADAIWLGGGLYDQDTQPTCLGNTVLIVIGRTCISVARSISAFMLSKGDEVEDYVSTICNSGVPYGFIKTKKGIYFLPSMNCVSKPLFLPHTTKMPKKKKQRIKFIKKFSCFDCEKKNKNIKSFKTKLIHKFNF